MTIISDEDNLVVGDDEDDDQADRNNSNQQRSRGSVDSMKAIAMAMQKMNPKGKFYPYSREPHRTKSHIELCQNLPIPTPSEDLAKPARKFLHQGKTIATKKVPPTVRKRRQKQQE